MGGNLEKTRARLRIGRRRSDSKSRRNRRNLGSDCAALRLWPHFRSLKATTPSAQRSRIAAVAGMQAAAGAGRATRARARPGKADEVEGRERRKKEKGEAGERTDKERASERAGTVKLMRDSPNDPPSHDAFQKIDGDK